jgi:hypothetical protein
LENEPATLKPATAVYAVNLLNTNSGKQHKHATTTEDGEESASELIQLTGFELADPVTTATPANVFGFATTVEQPRRILHTGKY